MKQPMMNELHMNMIHHQDELVESEVISNGNNNNIHTNNDMMISPNDILSSHNDTVQQFDNVISKSTLTDNDDVFDRDRLRVLLKCEVSLHYKKHDWIRKVIIKRYKHQNNNAKEDSIDSRINNKTDSIHQHKNSNSNEKHTTKTNNDIVEKIANVSFNEDEDNEDGGDSNGSDDNNNINDDIVDRNCRSLMIQWYYATIEMCNMDKYETIEIATSYMDRFMCTKKGQYIALHNNRQLFQLISVTCLYMSVKLFEQTIGIDSKTMVDVLCNGQYTIHELERTEIHILNELQWNVLHTPTTSLFLYEYIDYLLYEMKICLPNQHHRVEEEQKQMILDNAKEYTKWYHKSKDPIHMIMKSSEIAYQSILHAFHSVIIKPMSKQIVLSKQQKNDFFKRFRKSIDIDYDSEALRNISKKKLPKDSSSVNDSRSHNHHSRSHNHRNTGDDTMMIPKTISTNIMMDKIENLEEVECEVIISNSKSNVLKDEIIIIDSIDVTKHERRFIFDTIKTKLSSSNSIVSSTTTNDDSNNDKNYSSSLRNKKSETSSTKDSSPNNVLLLCCA